MVTNQNVLRTGITSFPKTSEIPPYPDSGVSFAGRYKIQSGTGWEIRNQRRFRWRDNIKSSRYPFGVKIWEGTKLFVSDIFLMVTVDFDTSPDSNFIVLMSDSSGKIFDWDFEENNLQYIPIIIPINLKTPIEIKDYLLIETANSRSLTAGELSIFGWIEE